MMDRSCGDCLFAELLGEWVWECRRHAPKPVMAPYDPDDRMARAETLWPTVTADDWCGKWKPRKPVMP